MRKIILAMPKTASTSLMQGVFEVTGIKTVQEFEYDSSRIRKHLKLKSRALLSRLPGKRLAGWAAERKLRNRFPTRDYFHLSQMHSDICSFTVDARRHVARMAESGCVYKQHYPPTVVNKALLADWHKVVIVRDSEEILESYSRTVAQHNGRGIRARLLGSQSFRTALVAELDIWREGWTRCDDVVVISYRELLADPRLAMKKVLAQFEMKTEVPLQFQLPKERYTRNDASAPR